MDLEKTLLRKVGEAVTRFKMIRDGDRVAVALSAGLARYWSRSLLSLALSIATLAAFVLAGAPT